MKKPTILILLLSLLSMFATGCATQSKQLNSEGPDQVLRKAFPNLVYESIEPMDINGMYEVVAGLNVFYFFPDKEYLFLGDIFTTAGKNLTAERKGEIAAKLVEKLPLEKSVKTGSGPVTVIQFTDPDCPYCRRAFEFFKERTDVTIYTFFSPFAHPAAIAKVYHILNATDKAGAYYDIFEGKSLEEPKEGYSDAIKQLAMEHMNLARSVGVTGTPTFFIKGRQVVGADIPQIEKLLAKSSKPDK